MQKRILIVDDDSRNIFALTAVLKAKGYYCLSSTDSLEGLKILEATDDVGIILLDMMMPELDGYEVIGKIKAGNKSHLPIIAVTAQAMAGDKQKCLDAGADGYISKPIDVDALLTVLQNYFM